MKTINKQIVMLCGILLLGIFSTVKAAVTPITPGVKLICDGGTFVLPAPASNTEWVVRFSITENDPTPSTGVNLAVDGVTISSPLTTGYYYLYSRGTAPGSCISSAQEIPLYVFKPLSVTIDAPSTYCVENASATTFTANITTTDAYNTYAYQWYTVSGGTETAISLATNATYVPTNVSPSTITYRVRVGFLVATDKFCPAVSPDKSVITSPIPAAPVISITNTGATF